MKMKKSHRKRGKKGRERELAGDDTRKKEKRKEKKFNILKFNLENNY